MISAYEARQMTLKNYIYIDTIADIIVQIERNIEAAIQLGKYSTTFSIADKMNYPPPMEIFDYLVQYGYEVTIRYEPPQYGESRKIDMWVFTVEWGTDGSSNERNE